MPELDRQENANVHALLDLDHFLPYRLSVLSNRISSEIAALYGERHGISVTEWRVMAVLGRYPGVSAMQVTERTAMDKVAVSRAVNALLVRDLLTRCTAADDRRRSELRLSPKGQAHYDEIVPQVLDYERRLLDRLSNTDRVVLHALLDRLGEAHRPVDTR